MAKRPATNQQRGSAGNVIAALCSFFIPGLGQLVQARLLAALFFFLATAIFYALAFLVITWPIAVIFHLWAIVNAALYAPD